jgi:hypothetical protein
MKAPHDGLHPIMIEDVPRFLEFGIRGISQGPGRSVLAQAVQAFGQEDDITVLTLTLAEPAHA